MKAKWYEKKNILEFLLKNGKTKKQELPGNLPNVEKSFGELSYFHASAFH